MTEKSFLNIRTGIAPLKLYKEFFFNESGVRDILLTPDQALITVIRWRRKRRLRLKIRVPCEDQESSG
jgi:hypothetical protein